MIEEGLFEQFPCDAIFAMHNGPGIPQGRLVMREGPMMASVDYVTITLHGMGGHGAIPHLANDPIVAASSIVMALQTIVSRNCDPQETAVISVGAFHAGHANNVIPDKAVLELSVRALTRETRDLLERRLRALVLAHAQGFGARADIDYRRSYPVLVNWPEPTRFAYEVAVEQFGSERCERNGPAVTASEDFACMLEKVPGSYVVIGNGDGKGSCMVHNPGYDFNDDNLITGPAYWVGLTERFLGNGPTNVIVDSPGTATA